MKWKLNELALERLDELARELLPMLCFSAEQGRRFPVPGDPSSFNQLAACCAWMSTDRAAAARIITAAAEAVAALRSGRDLRHGDLPHG